MDRLPAKYGNPQSCIDGPTGGSIDGPTQRFTNGWRACSDPWCILNPNECGKCFNNLCHLMHVNIPFVDSNGKIRGGLIVEGLPHRVRHSLGPKYVDAHRPPRDSGWREKRENVVKRRETGSQWSDDALTPTLTPEIDATRLSHRCRYVRVMGGRNFHETTFACFK